MSSKLIYHDWDSNGGVSPFDAVITDITKNEQVLIACPYLAVDYLKRILGRCKSWKIISDVEQWLLSHPVRLRQQVVRFIQSNCDRIRHCKNLHAKILVSGNRALVGSANFTEMGLTKRVEMSVLFEGEHIDEIRTWFEALWSQTKQVEAEELKRFVRAIHEHPAPEENFKSFQFDLRSDFPRIKAKFVEHGHSSQRTVITDQIDEQEILKLVISKSKTRQPELAIEIYELIKNHIPEALREAMTVRTNKQLSQISFIINSYLVFRLPYTGKRYGNHKHDGVYLIYPTDDLQNLKGIIDENRYEQILVEDPFAYFDCILPMMSYNEIKQFQPLQWQSVQKGLHIAKAARSIRKWNTNINVTW